MSSSPPRRRDRVSDTLSGFVAIPDRSWLPGQGSGEVPLSTVIRNPSLLLRDLVAGLISALVSISYSLAFAAMIFSGDLSGSIENGVRMALLSAGLTVIIVALTSPFFFAIAGPDSRSAAVQAALAAGLAGGLKAVGIKDPTPHVLITLALSTVSTGIALWALGRMRMGRWIRYVPYPVIGGFLVSTGWVLLLGGLGVMTKTRVSLESLSALFHPPVLRHLLVGVACASVYFLVLNWAKHFLWLPTLLIGGTILTHLTLIAFGISIEQAQRDGWLLEASGGGRLWPPLVEIFRHPIEIPVVSQQIYEVIVLVAVTAIAVLVTAAAIEVATKRDTDLDKELKGHGLANIAAGLCGGLCGSNAIARSMLNLQAGAASRLSGVVAGSFCLVILFLNPKLAGYLSRPIMGATLVFLGLRLMQEWLLRASSKLARVDYMIIVLMLALVIYTKTFVIGMFLGALASCLIFAVNYSRVSLIKNAFTCDEYGSKVQRSAEEHQVLRQRGRQFWVLRLRGYLFFGSIVGLVNDVQRRIKESFDKDLQPLRVLVLDFRYVNGMDSSAVLSIVKLRQIIEERKMQLVFTELQPEMERALRRENCLRNDKVVLVFPNLDDALEWCEQQAMELEPSLHRIDLPFVQRLGKEFGSVEIAQRFMQYVQKIELGKGEYLFRQGDDSGATYVVENGRLSIVFERPDGPPLLLRSVTGNTTIGEMGLYRQSIRSASVMANAQTTVHRLTHGALERMETEDPQVAAAFHTYVIRTLADRLHLMDKAISALER